jgi:hypothetical protein
MRQNYRSNPNPYGLERAKITLTWGEVFWRHYLQDSSSSHRHDCRCFHQSPTHRHCRRMNREIPGAPQLKGRVDWLGRCRPAQLICTTPVRNFVIKVPTCQVHNPCLGRAPRFKLDGIKEFSMPILELRSWEFDLGCDLFSNHGENLTVWRVF